MRLQLALDDISLEDGICLLETLGDTIDIVEVGTPMIIAYGMEAVRTIRRRFPKLTITSDAKIMDAGEYEASQCFEAGADIVTVMGFTHDATVSGAVAAASKFGGAVMADLMCVEDLAERASALKELGVRYACVHTAVDVQNTENPYTALARIRSALPGDHCCIAGGISAQTIPEIAGHNPAIVIVGGGITKAGDPAAVAREIHAKMASL